MRGVLNVCVSRGAVRALCQTNSCVTQTNSGLFVEPLWEREPSRCGRSQSGVYSTLRCHFGVRSQTSSQRELHHPGSVRLAQPVAEVHHGRWTSDADREAGVQIWYFDEPYGKTTKCSVPVSDVFCSCCLLTADYFCSWSWMSDLVIDVVLYFFS